MKIIAVDFDGTIAKTRYPHIESLIPEAMYIRKWRRKGHKVILWTCRENKELQEAVDFCLQNGIQFDAVNENLPEMIGNPRKLGADIFLDDKLPMPVQLQWRTVNQILGG